jgi:solute carrier family 25 phosphate transporter 23/24/25/41
MRDEGGFRALYRGLVATAMGVAPYVGINFAAYEALRSVLTPPGKNGVARKLSCGALAGRRSHVSVIRDPSDFIWLGSISQTLTYPFDVLRRKMQVIGLGPGALGYQYNSALDAARVIFKTEGIRGMYRGLWPNLCEFDYCQVALSRLMGSVTVKVAPSIATSFFTYELVKEFLLAERGRER